MRAAGASRHRAARAREVLVMESFLSARAAGKLVAALLGKRKPLSRLKRKSAAVAVGVLADERFQDGENFFLLAAGGAILGIAIAASDVGGGTGRTARLFLDSGRLYVKTTDGRTVDL